MSDETKLQILFTISGVIVLGIIAVGCRFIS